MALKQIAFACLGFDIFFSNVLLESKGQIRLIDMRGMTGKDLSMGGDAFYDLAKVYQSLCGEFLNSALRHFRKGLRN